MVDKLEFFLTKQVESVSVYWRHCYIALMYVDDILMCSTEDQNMIDLTNLLNTEVVDIEE